MADPRHEQILRAAQGERPHSGARQSTGSGDPDDTDQLYGLDLSGILATSLRLAGRRLVGANLRKASLNGGYFQDCDLSEADLRQANLTLADMRGANLTSARMERADLSSAILVRASLCGANLQSAKLVKCRLEGADLTDANLAEADLRGVKGITNDQLDSACHADQAILDNRTLKSLGRNSNHSQDVTRSGRRGASKTSRARGLPPDTRELKCSRPKPKFGDLFQIFGAQHPDFPAENNYASLQGWEIEQTDDYFAWHQQGDPAIWIFPVVRGEVVHHHPGPYDALRIQLVQPKAREAWTALCEALATVLDH